MLPNEKHVDSETVATNGETKLVDQAALFLAEAGSFQPFTAKQEQRLKRKIDFILIPMVRLLYSILRLGLTISALITAPLGAVDKVAMSTAAVYGLREDNNLIGQQYSWLGSILSLDALVGMFPSSALIHRFPAAKYICCCYIFWSTMALLVPACSNFSGLMTLRFLMGAAEAIIVPGISLIIAGWYRKGEQPP